MPLSKSSLNHQGQKLDGYLNRLVQSNTNLYIGTTFFDYTNNILVIKIMNSAKYAMFHITQTPYGQ